MLKNRRKRVHYLGVNTGIGKGKKHHLSFGVHRVIQTYTNLCLINWSFKSQSPKIGPTKRGGGGDEICLKKPPGTLLISVNSFPKLSNGNCTPKWDSKLGPSRIAFFEECL